MIDDRLRSAFDDVRRLDPDPADKFAAVMDRAHRRAMAQRALAGTAALLLLVVGAAAVVVASDDGDGKTIAATDGATPETVPPETSTTTTTGLLGLPTITAPSTVVPTPTTTRPPRTTTTTTPGTTTTTAPAPAPEPHAAYASVKGAEVQANQGSYCWRGGEGQAALCADYASTWGDNAPVLAASTGDVLMWRWATSAQPKSVTALVYAYAGGKVVWSNGKQVECAGGNPCRIALDLGAGDYFVMVGSYWSEGSTSNGVRLHVGD